MPPRSTGLLNALPYQEQVYRAWSRETGKVSFVRRRVAGSDLRRLPVPGAGVGCRRGVAGGRRLWSECAEAQSGWGLLPPSASSRCLSRWKVAWSIPVAA